jgi:hypothetical protein
MKQCCRELNKPEELSERINYSEILFFLSRYREREMIENIIRVIIRKDISIIFLLFETGDDIDDILKISDRVSQELSKKFIDKFEDLMYNDIEALESDIPRSVRKVFDSKRRTKDDKFIKLNNMIDKIFCWFSDSIKYLYSFFYQEEEKCGICCDGEKNKKLSCCNNEICENCYGKISSCPYCRCQNFIDQTVI